MTKVKTYDSQTFEEQELELDDFQYNLAQRIKDHLIDLEPTPMLFLKDKVCIGIFQPLPSKRPSGTKWTAKYKIVIEKIVE